MKLTEEQIRVLKGNDFMRIGMSMTNGNWNGAQMAALRLSKSLEECGLNSFERNMRSLRQCLNRRELADCKECMALITAKRVALLKEVYGKEGEMANDTI